MAADQRLDLNKLGPNDNDTVRGQVVGKKHTLFCLVADGSDISFTSCAFYARSTYERVQRVSEIRILYFLKAFNYLRCIFINNVYYTGIRIR